jgi:signal transduction histidine kinase
MTGLVEGLLVLARADAGHLLLEVGEVSVKSLREALEEVLRLLPGGERVTLTCAAPGGAKIAGDRLLLAMAVRNLVENALVHAPVGSVRVHLAAPPKGGLELVVEDRGPGIPAAVLALLRSEAPASRRNGQAGLGLSIARAVVESHGGRLVLENRPDAGCQAVIWLPGLEADSTPV